MVDLCPVIKWSGIQMVVWKPNWKKTLVQNVRYSNGPPSQMPILSSIQMNPVFSIQMVTVLLHNFRWSLDVLRNDRRVLLYPDSIDPHHWLCTFVGWGLGRVRHSVFCLLGGKHEWRHSKFAILWTLFSSDAKFGNFKFPLGLGWVAKKYKRGLIGIKKLLFK